MLYEGEGDAWDELNVLGAFEVWMIVFEMKGDICVSDIGYFACNLYWMSNICTNDMNLSDVYVNAMGVSDMGENDTRQEQKPTLLQITMSGTRKWEPATKGDNRGKSNIEQQQTDCKSQCQGLTNDSGRAEATIGKRNMEQQ